jgi:hypothetical protein
MDRKNVCCFLLGLMLVVFSSVELTSKTDSKILILTFNYKDGNITLIDQKIVPGELPKRRASKKVTAAKLVLKLIDNNDKEIAEEIIGNPSVILTDALDENSKEEGGLKGGEKELNNVDFVVRIKYDEKTKKAGKIHFFKPKPGKDGKIEKFDMMSEQKISVK